LRYCRHVDGHVDEVCQDLTERWSAKTQEPSGQTVQTGSSRLQSVQYPEHPAFIEPVTRPFLDGCQLEWGLDIRPISRDKPTPRYARCRLALVYYRR